MIKKNGIAKIEMVLDNKEASKVIDSLKKQKDTKVSKK